MVSLFLLVILVVIAIGFWRTGGRSLAGLYFNYLTKDLPDKKYSQADFLESRDDTQISGYFAGRLGDNLFIWNLSGLKRYFHDGGKSVYYYMDTCRLIRNISAEQAKSGEERVSHELTPEYFFDPTTWATRARAGDYVLLRFVRDENGNKLIDKLQGNSNQHFPIEELRDEQCQN
ncbi:MAG: hypothetical protein HYZ22_01285 [Chloroflexi bacterium]|nr:hypothetical protein [Chloroflexota bacterium]